MCTKHLSILFFILTIALTIPLLGHTHLIITPSEKAHLTIPLICIFPMTLSQEQKKAQELLEAQEAHEREANKRIKNYMRRMRSTANDAMRMRSGARFTIRVAREHRRAIKEGHFHVFFLAFSLAIAKDMFLDPILHIPIFGLLLLGLPASFISLYLFIFLWGRGTFLTRRGGLYLKRLVRVGIITADLLVPIISLFPLTTFCVYLAYRDARKAREEALKTENEFFDKKPFPRANPAHS